jgi:hypothetical protein
LLHGLELLLNTADINCLLTFNIALSQVFSDLFYFLPDTTDSPSKIPGFFSMFKLPAHHAAKIKQKNGGI